MSIDPTFEDRLFARLDALETKLDYVVERQAFTEDLIREMTPVAREALHAVALEMQGYEERGWFAMGKEMVALFDRLAQAYGPDDVREFSEHVVQIVDTVRNVTQPDVLDFANDATDVLHHADDMDPVGPLGVAKAVGDADVRRGMAVALQVLRHLGQVSGEHQERARRPAPPSAPRPTPTTQAAAAPSAPVEPPTQDVVEWQGRRFCGEGFLLDIDQWDEELAAAMAQGLGLTLSDDHWRVIRWARRDCLETGASPNVRRVAQGSGVGTQRLYELFPGKPGKAIAMVAGIPKPTGCV